MTYTLIQAWRALLCIGVVLIHIKIYLVRQGTPSLFGYMPEILGGIPCAFFAVSGYFMATLVDRNTYNFLPQRLIRVYPMYLLVIALSFIIREFSNHPMNFKGLPLAISLMPFGMSVQYRLGIEWTLVYEIFYYLVCWVFCRQALHKHFPKFLIVWMLAIILKNVVAPDIPPLPTMLTIWLSGWNYCFIAGALLFYALHRWNEPATQVWAQVLLFASLCVVSSTFILGQSMVYLLGVACCVVMAALIKLESRVRAPKLLSELGDYSYALYLIHTNFIVVTFDRWVYFTGEKPGLVTGLFALVLCMSGFWFLGQLDVAIHKRTRRWVNAQCADGRIAWVDDAFTTGRLAWIPRFLASLGLLADRPLQATGPAMPTPPVDATGQPLTAFQPVAANSKTLPPTDGS